MKVKQPKNSLIAIMVLINIALTLFVLFKNSDVELEKTVNAHSLYEEIDSANRKKDESVNPNTVEEADEADEADETILYNIKAVTSYDSDYPTMPLYYHHSNEEGAWFTYKPLEEGEVWESGYWFVDHKTLKEANIHYLTMNDVIQGVFYDGEYFEIKEVLATNN